MLSAHESKNIPNKPGIYLFKDRSNKIIYVGKAKDLNKRIHSYFAKGKDQAGKVFFILRSARKIDHIITDNEKEALILEGNYIKKYRPRYNVTFKDDANYPLLKLDIFNP